MEKKTRVMREGGGKTALSKNGHLQMEEDGTRTLLYGMKPVLEHLLDSPLQVEHVYVRADKNDAGRIMDACRAGRVRFSLVPKSFLDRLCPGNHQGVAAILALSRAVALDILLREGTDAPLPLVAALDAVQDPGNVGTFARTLYALGGAGLVVTRHNSAHLGSAALRSSAGALAHLPVARVTNLAGALEEAADAGYAIYGLARTAGAQPLFSLCPAWPAVVVLGSEGRGIRPGVARRCLQMVHIPFAREFDSLNVAQAGAIAVGWFLAQWRKNHLSVS